VGYGIHIAQVSGMTRRTRHTATTFVAALLVSIGLGAQTKIERHSNRYTPEQDVQLGREAAAEVRQQMPVIDGGAVGELVREVGQRLVDEIPEEFHEAAFRYSFEVVNLKEINAFALPGGPMFLHRGMIEAAKSDAEVAGVMAHELSHVVLRHGTAQATKGQKFQIGAIAGQILGAIVGGTRGEIISAGSQIGLGTYFLKYGREYEREADLLGAQIMARAGYDPRQMANMFRTIQQQGGNRGPEWLSSHPDPGNRYDAINREAQMVRVDGRADTADEFQQARAQLSQMSPAPTSQQVAAQAQQGRRERTSAGAGGRNIRVEPPSGDWRTYQPGDFLQVTVPGNWQQLSGGNTVTYAPEGGYHQGPNGASAVTHGVEIGVARADGGDLRRTTDALIESFARSNPQLRRQGGYSRTTIGGRQGLTTLLTNVSEVTGQSEAVNLSTVSLRDGSVLFIIGVAPADQARAYLNTFAQVRRSLQLNDR
jgi:hypothetical protein